MTTTKAEADAGDALWRRLTIPEKERRKLIDEYRDAVLHGAAEKIRALDGWDPSNGWAGYEEGQRIAADWIDPTKQEQP